MQIYIESLLYIISIIERRFVVAGSVRNIETTTGPMGGDETEFKLRPLQPFCKVPINLSTTIY